MIAVGLMSGTSVDGVDAAAIELDVLRSGVRVLATTSEPYDDATRARVLALGEGETTDPRELARLHAALGERYAAMAERVCASLPRRPDVIAVHGQTIAHLPDARVTLQIGDAARVARRTGIPVVSDLRSADLAAGGEGAPLVSFADHALFARLAPVAVLNLGGIANLTLIPTGSPDEVIAFDTGPANMVVDALAATVGERFDAGGARGARGRVDEETLSELLSHPYFERRPPKSTGRELFGREFAERLHELVARHGGSLDDAIATATALTARTVARGLALAGGRRPSRLLVAGGGARNPTLMAMLGDALPGTLVEPTDAHGVPAAYREAVAFAILGAYRLRGLPNTLPSATGADRAVSGGALHIP